MPAKCLVCGEQFESNSVVCVKCNTPHHEDCFNSTGCSIYGCGSTEYYSPNLVDGNLIGIEKKKANIASLVSKKDTLVINQYNLDTILETVLNHFDGNYANDAITRRTAQMNKYTMHHNNSHSIIDDFINKFENAKLAGLDFDKAINHSFNNMHIRNDAIRQPLCDIANELDNKRESYLRDGKDGYALFGLGVGVFGGLAVSKFIEYYCNVNIESFLIGFGSIISGTIGYHLYPLIDNKDDIIARLQEDKKELADKWHPRLEELLETKDNRQRYVETGSNLLLPND